MHFMADFTPKCHGFVKGTKKVTPGSHWMWKWSKEAHPRKLHVSFSPPVYTQTFHYDGRQVLLLKVIFSSTSVLHRPSGLDIIFMPFFLTFLPWLQFVNTLTNITYTDMVAFVNHGDLFWKLLLVWRLSGFPMFLWVTSCPAWLGSLVVFAQN